MFALVLGVLWVGAAPGVAERATDAQQNVRALEVELSGLDAQAVEAQAGEREAAAALAAARVRVRANALALRVAVRDHRTAQQRLAAQLVALYRQDRPGFVEILLTSGGLSDALDQVDALERLGRQDADLVNTLRAARERMRRARTALIAQRRGAAAELAVATARRRRTEAVLVQRRAVLVDARQRLASIIAAEEASRQAAARQAARISALRAAQAAVQARIAQPDAVAAPAPAPAAPGAYPSQATLDKIAQCESGGDPRAVSPSGQYRGKYQFDPGTWASVGGTGDPAAAPASVQDRLAARLYSQRGSSPWPVCGR